MVFGPVAHWLSLTDGQTAADAVGNRDQGAQRTDLAPGSLKASFARLVGGITYRAVVSDP